MEALRQQLANVLAQLDTEQKMEPHQMTSALEPIVVAAKEVGVEIKELEFERVAAELSVDDEPSVWGTHYGPWLTRETSTGRLDRPSLVEITPDCIAYWTARIRETTHPALRARYGDLVWDLSQLVTGNRPPIDAAHTAIDGYVEAICDGRCETFDGSVDIQKRAIALATMVDVNRLTNIVPRLQQYAASPPEPEERDRRQLELFGILDSLTGNRRPVNALHSLAADLRERLDELAAAEADKSTIGDLAIPLANYYRSAQQLEQAQAVLRIWGSAVKRLANATNSGMLAAAWLREVHDLYPRFQMHEDAGALVGDIEAASAGIELELVRISHSVEIPQEKLDRVVDELTSGTKEEVLRKLAVNFVPQVNDTEKIIREVSSNTIYMNLTQAIVADDGRVTATIGPVCDDLDGHIIQQLGLVNQFYGQIFRPTIEEAMRRHQLTDDDIANWLAGSPLFDADRLQLLKPAIAAYLRGEWSTSIHLAVPQIENALRQLLRLAGQALFRPHRNGTFVLKNLDEVLRDPFVERALPRDVRIHLQTVLCDQRSLNIRNNVCHGLWSSSHFNWFTADRVFHAVLLIGLLRTGPGAEEHHVQPEDEL